MSDKPSDPNPVMRSMIETARELWSAMAPGGTARVSCCTGLLTRHEPGAQERLRHWAEGHDMSVQVNQQETPQGSRIAPPEILTIEFTRRLTPNPDKDTH